MEKMKKNREFRVGDIWWMETRNRIWVCVEKDGGQIKCNCLSHPACGSMHVVPLNPDRSDSIRLLTQAEADLLLADTERWRWSV